MYSVVDRFYLSFSHFKALSYAQDNCNIRLTSKIISFYGFESVEPVEYGECEGTCFSQSKQNSCNATIIRENCRCCRPDVTEKRTTVFNLIKIFRFDYLVEFDITITKSCRCGPCN